MDGEAPGRKALRLLEEGRVTVVRASEWGARARVRGDSGSYSTLIWAHGENGCTCGFEGEGWCSHLRAVALLVRPKARAACGLPESPAELLA